MDYDGNDTQCYNLKVASEDTSKSSSVLRPYAFPRFDIDDSLQEGDLRFNSLVETDAFLGIQNQDDNQWIEDFSRGSDVINFSSSNTESCSIARQNNVWYEATSSESVEMLLKSVGQEQMQPKDIVVGENSNTYNELSNLEKKMESKFEQDNVNGGSRISNATILQDELLNNFPAMENNVEGKLSEVEEISLSQKNLIHGDEGSIQSCPTGFEEECKQPVAEEDLLVGTACDNRNMQVVEGPVDVCLDQTTDGLSHFAGPAQDINARSSIPAPSQSPNQVSSHSEGADAFTRATVDTIKEQLASKEMVHADTQIMERLKPEDVMHSEVPCSFTSSTECVNESSMMTCAQECQFQLLEGRGSGNSLASPTLPGCGQTDILSTSRVLTVASTVGDLLTNNSEQQATKFGNPDAAHCPSSEGNADSAEKLYQKLSSDEMDNMTEISHNEDGQGNSVSGSYFQSSLMEGENQLSNDKISNATMVDLDKSLISPVSPSPIGLNKNSDGDESIKDHVAANMEGSRSSGQREDLQVEADQHFNVTESESISVETKKEEGVSLSTSVIDASPGTAIAPSSDQGSSAMMRFMNHDERIANQPHSENAANAIPSKTNNSIIEVNNEDIHEQVAAEVGSGCEAQSGIHHDSTAALLSCTDGKLIPVIETSNVLSGKESPTPNSRDCTMKLEVQLSCDDLVMNKDPLKLECSSQTLFSSIVLPPDEGKQKGDGDSEFAENKPSTSEDPKGKDTSLDENFTFKVNLPPNAERDKANTWTPFPIAETYKSSVVLEGVTTPDTAKIQARSPQDASGNNPGDYTHGISKAASGRKKRGSAKGVAKEILDKELNVKEITPYRPSHKEEKVFSVSLCPGSSLPGLPVGSQPHGLTKQNSKKLSTNIVSPTSKLPDLNASILRNHAAPSTAFQQPFTESQQLQLRAQIFVYGSLIQGTAPDEACMVSAFGPSDRGRSVWEQVWQAAVERVRRRKSQPGGQSPMSSNSSGAKVPGLAGNQVSPETKVFPSSVNRTASKGTPTAILSPIIPLSSPHWSISTPYHDVFQSSNLQRRPILQYQPAVSPRPPYHTPPVQNISGHTTQQSQAPASPIPWALQTSTINLNARSPTTAKTEIIKLTPVKDFPLPVPSVPSLPLVYTDTTSTVSARCSQLPDQGCLSSEVPPSAGSKPRRRKKAQLSDITPQHSLLSRAQTETIAASSSLSTHASPVTTRNPTYDVTTRLRDVFPARSTFQPQAVGNLDAGKSSTSTVRKVEDAKLQAEEAAVLASTAISHCQSLWSQMAKQDFGMTREAEVQVAALAGAAAAAASVAKAAAAAAMIASKAAMQAKLMADEAFNPTALGDVTQSRNHVSTVQSVGKATPMSILTTDGGANQSTYILADEKEAAKRKVEAEIFDGILEAAKLAGEAVSQAGKVVAMGEPLPLKEIISVGPEGYWKLCQAASELVPESGNVKGEHMNMGNAQAVEISSKEYGGGPPGGKISDHRRILMEEPSNDSFGDKTRSAFGISESIGAGDKDPGVGKSLISSDVVQSNRELVVPGNSSESGYVQNQHELGSVHGSNIKEGSAVEVYKDGDDLKPAWFSANVVTLHDGKALVQYTSLLSKEGSDNLKEWVALEAEAGKAPRIRPVLPMTVLHSQGTRKRRRSALGNYAWIVGDSIDAWIHNRWCEGIVTEKHDKDEATLTVHFPARGETSAVSTQQIRPSFIWTDGNWVPRSRGHNCSNESDMPLEKRPRLKSPLEKNKSEGAEYVTGKREESKLKGLSATDMVFNVGKADTKPNSRQTLKTGLQRQGGSRVVIGVPKPGKKRKFVEVSKHFPAAQIRKDSESKGQVKFAKYLIPQGTTSRAGRNLSKVDPKERQSLKVTSLKPHSSSSRTVPHRENLDVEKSLVHEEETLKTAAQKNHGSPSTYLGKQGKSAPAWGKLTKVDEEKVDDDNNESLQIEAGDEPRRSNRRIQPTHRLLEGLQSSLVIPKMTYVSHDIKGQDPKSRSTSTSSRGK